MLLVEGLVERGSRTPDAMTSSMTASTLWQAVFASPDEDAPRLVLSDFLQEQGDPRGEFIALQVREARGQASLTEVERARELSKQHGAAWLGALRPALAKAEMRRGFLWRIELGRASATSKWPTHARDPQLATVERVVRGDGAKKHLSLFMQSGALKNLRVGIAEEMLLGAPSPRVETVSDQSPSPEVIALIAGNPSLTGLSITLEVTQRGKEWSATRWAHRVKMAPPPSM